MARALSLHAGQGIGGLPEGRAATVVDAFFFSVQTLGSIGYGVLHPTSLWVNLLVTLESLCGLLFIAITTGLAFSRFSKSRARLRFSDVAFRISFGTDDLRMNERFVDMVRMDGPDSVCLDFRRFDQTEPVVADAGI